MRILALLLLPLLWLLPSTVSAADAAGPGEACARARASYQELLKAPKKMRYRDQWELVIDRSLLVARKYPGTPEGAEGLFLAGKAWQGLYQVSQVADDAHQAVAVFLRLPDEYPGSPLADDALLAAARLEETALGDRAAAWGLYRDTVERYPRGDQVDAARERRDALARFAPAQRVAIPSPKTGGSAPKPGKRQALNDIRFWSNPGYTRVVLYLSAQVGYTANFIPAESGSGSNPRLYLDLAGAVPAGGLAETTPVGDGLLKQIRTGRPEPGKVRVVLDLVSFRDYKIIPLEDPYRIVIDIAGADFPELKNNPPQLIATPAGGDGIGKVLEAVPADKPLAVQLPKLHGGTLRRIVVDAGHGGKDPGAIGPHGIQEKDVALALAREVGKQLEKDLGCEVILTRSDDTFIPLEERTAIANKVGADLFISIHANASPKGSAYGIETYYLNFSKNDQAVAVAARENGTSLKQVGDLELILFDLMANAKINESSRLAAEIQRALVEDLDRSYSSVRDLGVRQGPFYVLLGATMPSVLVETAFISHAREEARLQDPAFRAKAAEAIVRGVRSYAAVPKVIAAQ